MLIQATVPGRAGSVAGGPAACSLALAGEAGGFMCSPTTTGPGSPKRNLRGLVLIAEIIRRFDVIALQEVKRDTTALRYLMEHLLGPQWALMLTDVTAGLKGNIERMAYLYDTRRVTPSGLSGQIVLPPTPDGGPVEQFDRTPYLVGFRVGSERFTLLTAHIRYGNTPDDRLPELERFARYTAGEIRDRVRSGSSREEPNLIVLATSTSTGANAILCSMPSSRPGCGFPRPCVRFVPRMGPRPSTTIRLPGSGMISS